MGIINMTPRCQAGKVNENLLYHWRLVIYMWTFKNAKDERSNITIQVGQERRHKKKGKCHCCATKTSFPILCILHWILFMSTWNRCQHHFHRCSLESLQVSELWSLKDSRSFLMGFLTSLAKVHSSPRMWCWQKHVFPSFAYAFCKLWINGLVLFLLREWYQWGVESDPSTECRQRSGTYSYASFFVYMSGYKQDLEIINTIRKSHTYEQ